MSNQSGLAEVGDSKRERNYLLTRSVFNVRVANVHRVDYEARSLRACKNAVDRVRSAIARASKPSELALLVSSLDKLLERQRILLRIPLPRSDGAVKSAHSPMIEATPTVAPTAPSVPSSGQ